MEMGDSLDANIRNGLKNWAAEQPPPKNGRARLLLVAARMATAQDLTSTYHDAQGHVNLIAISDRLPHVQAQGSFYQPFLWVLQLHFTPIKNVF